MLDDVEEVVEDEDEDGVEVETPLVGVTEAESGVVDVTGELKLGCE